MKYKNTFKLLLPITVTILPVTVLLISLLFHGENKTVNSENRTASTFESLKQTTYIDKTFQDEIENVLLDQFPASEKIKITKNKIDSFLINIFRKNIVKQNCEIGRNEIRNGVYNLFCTDYLVSQELQYEYIEKNLFIMQQSMLSYDLKNADYYAYLVNDSKTFNDLERTSNQKIYDIFNYDLSCIGFETEQFRVDSLEEYMKYFYKTDHHWNIEGAYKGYQDILKMLNISNKTNIKESTILDGSFCGSHCREIGMFDINDPFEVLLYDYENLDIYINSIKGSYGLEKEFFFDNSIDEYSNFYGTVFGGDYGEIKIVNNNETADKNILVISNSMSNPINKMIANSFKESYIVDLRHYEKDMNESFNLDDYVNDKKIDIVLFLGNIDFYIDLINQLEYVK